MSNQIEKIIKLRFYQKTPYELNKNPLYINIISYSKYPFSEQKLNLYPPMVQMH